MRIPKWVEVTEGEVPTTLTYHGPTEHFNAVPTATTREDPTTVGAQHHYLAVG